MGVFIYKTKGKFPTNSFVAEGVDVFLMSRGEPSEVGIDSLNSYHGKNLINDIIDHDYEEYQRCIIHSHHGMSTGFSSTDTNQLKQWASTNPYYMSIVINNALEFTAKIAIKSTEVYKGYSYIKDLNNKQIKIPKTFERESYQTVELNVVVDYPEYMISVNDRIKNIQEYKIPTLAYDSQWNDYYKTKQAPAYTKPKKTKESIHDYYFPSIRIHLKELERTCTSTEDFADSIIFDMQYNIPLEAYIDYFKENPLRTVYFTELIVQKLKAKEVNGK